MTRIRFACLLLAIALIALLGTIDAGIPDAQQETTHAAVA